MNGIDASWVLGHCGASCLRRSYWPLTWQLVSSENKPLTTEMLSTSTDLVHIETDGCVTKFLVDGGTALGAAVENVARVASGQENRPIAGNHLRHSRYSDFRDIAVGRRQFEVDDFVSSLDGKFRIYKSCKLQESGY